MQPELQTNRTQATQERDFDLGKLVAPVLKAGLEVTFESFAFGPVSKAVASLFRENPARFANLPLPDGTTLPSIRSMLLNDAIEERAAQFA
jgi:hypothetical protein